MKREIILFIAAAVFSSSLIANESPLLHSEISTDLLPEDIYIYDFAYGGSGCPSGSVDAVMSPDHTTISMFFDKYIADSTESSRGRTRKSCNLGVSVKVPHGLTVALISLDYRGYVDVAKKAFSSLQAEYFFAGEPAGNTFLKEWSDPNHPVVEDFIEHDDFPIGTIVWSACGKDAILRANTSVKAYQGPEKQPAFIQVDTVDTTAEIIYQLQWKTCDPV